MTRTINTTNGWNSSGGDKSRKFKARCYETHPAFEIAPGVDVYGGSCLNPAWKADVYVGFDRGMRLDARSMPWNGPSQVLYEIIDRKAPKSKTEFKSLLKWLEKVLADGKTLHMGCIGGHGRTGTVLAALRYTMTGDKGSMHAVRENYCKKAIETAEQVKFLQDMFGLDPVEPRYGSVSRSRLGGASEPIDFRSGSDTVGDSSGSLWDDFPELSDEAYSKRGHGPR